MNPNTIIKSDIEFIVKKDETQITNITSASFICHSTKAGSEKSYEDLQSHEELLNNVAFFTFNPIWQYLTSLSNYGLYWILTYNQYFNNKFEEKTLVHWVKIVCNIVIVMDITGAYLHSTWKDVREKKVFKPRPVFFQVCDVISLLSVPLGLVPFLRGFAVLRIIETILILVRFYRIMSFFVFISSTAGNDTVMNLCLKHMLVFAFILHSFGCLWMYEGCYKCKDKDHDTWPDRDSYLSALDETNSPAPQQFSMYILCLMHTIGGITSVAIGTGSTEQNEFEKIFLITLMTVNIYYLNGMCIGTFSNVQCNNYIRETQFTNKFKIIVNNLATHKASKTLTDQMLDYYIHYWKQEDAICESELFDSLPPSIRQSVLLDKFWFSLNQAHLFMNLEDGFKRAVACHMTTKICIPDEVIFDIEQPRDCMIYIAKGSVHLLSVVDGESPLITLGVGTCIGEINLVYGAINPTKVIAATYCTVYILSKAKLWEEILNFKQFNQTPILHTTTRQLIEYAKSSIHKTVELGNDETPLQKIKRSLQTEDDVRLLDYTKVHVLTFERKLSDLYVLSRRSNVHSDAVFLNTSWPWILNAESAFWNVWETIVIFTVLLESIGYPLEITYYRRLSTGYWSMYRVFGSTIFLVDVIFKLFAAVESEEGLYGTAIEIGLQRFSSLSFLADIVAIIPLSSLVRVCGITDDERIITILYTNKLLKLYRIITFVDKLEYNFKLNVSYVRLSKYIIYLLYSTYLYGCLYYMVLCFNEVCFENMALGKKTADQFTYAIMTAMLIMSCTGGVIDYFSINEIGIILVIAIVGTMTCIYLIGDYNATLTLAGAEASEFLETIGVINSFMESNEIVQHIQIRMNNYYNMQWMVSKGVNFNELYNDAPTQLFEEFQARKYTKILNSVHLFHHVNYKIIKKIAVACETVSLPPNEYCTYAGEIPRDIYIIERGFVEVVFGSSQKVDKILGPLDNFCVLETLLEEPGIFNVRTITHAILIKIGLSTVMEAFLTNTELAKQLNNFIIETKESFTARRLFSQTTSQVEHTNVEEEDRSWCVFPASIVDPKHIDYMYGWSKMNMLRFLMLKRTIMPYGQFICYWEMSRTLFAFLSAMIHPAMHVYTCYIPEIKWLCIILDIMGALDMYIRLHVCYYNKHGILVTHPRMTAGNYLKSSFMIDLIATFPTDYAVYAIERKDILRFNTFQAFIRLNRVLQMYRIPDGFSMFKKNILEGTGFILTCVQYTLMTFIVMNTLSIVIVNTSVQIHALKDGRTNIVPYENTWISSSNSSFVFNNEIPVNIYLIAFYWVSTTAEQLSYGNVLPQTNQEVLYVLFVIVIGYMWFTYILIIISNNKASINGHLTLYQSHMKRLIWFMKKERIPNNLQTLAIDHFEYLWQRTQGMEANMILETCHLALKRDCAMYLYADTFKLVPIFTDMKASFYRMLGPEININYFLKGFTIIKINDVVNTLYIVHKGEVNVVGPDGTLFQVLKRGCVFGNLDDIHSIRSMVSIISATNVDLLTIKTLAFYDLLKDYPVIKNRISKHILLHNLSYIASEVENNEEFDYSKKESVKEKQKSTTANKFLTGNLLHYVLMTTSFLSYTLTSYQMAFQDYSIHFFIITYLLDIFHIAKIYIGFVAPYEDEIGDIVTDMKMIRNRYLTTSRFYLDLAGVLPIEIMSLLSPSDTIISTLCILRLNRALRLWNIFNFFAINDNLLNINVLAIKLASIVINMALLTHTEACIWAIMGTRLENRENGWTYNDNGVCSCYYLYLCALYFAVNSTSSSGYGNIRARNFREVVFAVFISLFNKIMTAVIIGDMSSVAGTYISTLTDFDYGRTKMELFLKHSVISNPLFKGVMSYTWQLWFKNEGFQIPVFMTQAPSFLSSRIKFSAFGYHLNENLVFMSCHEDFLFLLSKKIKIQMYFTDDIICHHGDVNGTMYFIHKGSVNAYYVTDTEETHVDSLVQKDCFGMIQGLFPNTPHTHTFKAMNVVTMLSLELKSWVHLLQFYPASKFIIYDKMSQLDKITKF